MDLTSLVLLVVGLAAGVALGAGLVRSGAARSLAERPPPRLSVTGCSPTGQRSSCARPAPSRRRPPVAATLEAERIAAERRLEELRGEQSRQSEQFQALAAKALQHNNEAFLTLADQRLKASQDTQAAELAKRTTEVQQLVEPIRATLDKVAVSIAESDKSRATSHAGLMEQVRLANATSQQLQTETRTLVGALKAPQARGAWGEMQLRRVVELAGMLERVDFDTQVSRTTDDGVQRPDMVIHLAGGKQIVVDAKVSLAAFLDGSPVQRARRRAPPG